MGSAVDIAGNVISLGLSALLDLNATGKRRPVMRVTLPGAIGKAMRDGGLLPAPGTQTFDQWLAARSAEGVQR